MILGRIAQAPMSQPPRPTLLKRNATLAPLAASRMSDAMAMIAPAPAQMPSTAATIGCGQARIALTRSPVIRVNAVSPLVSIFTSGPMTPRNDDVISCGRAVDERDACLNAIGANPKGLASTRGEDAGV